MLNSLIEKGFEILSFTENTFKIYDIIEATTEIFSYDYIIFLVDHGIFNTSGISAFISISINRKYFSKHNIYNRLNSILDKKSLVIDNDFYLFLCDIYYSNEVINNMADTGTMSFVVDSYDDFNDELSIYNQMTGYDYIVNCGLFFMRFRGGDVEVVSNRKFVCADSDGSPYGVFSKSSFNGNLDLNHVDFSRVTSMKGFFYDSAFKSIDMRLIRVYGITDMSDMFWNCSYLEKVSIDIDTSKVKTMYGMFQDCIRLVDFDFTTFDTSNVTDFGVMFSGTRMKNYDLSSFDTSSGVNFRFMFQNTQIDKLDLSNFSFMSASTVAEMFKNAEIRSLTINDWRDYCNVDYDIFRGLKSRELNIISDEPLDYDYLSSLVEDK